MVRLVGTSFIMTKTRELMGSALKAEMATFLTICRIGPSSSVLTSAADKG
jgi:hypothetical protein